MSTTAVHAPTHLLRGRISACFLVIAGLVMAGLIGAPGASAAPTPGKPREVVAASVGTGSVTLSWRVPGKKGKAVRGYRVGYSSDGGRTWSGTMKVDKRTTRLTVHGLNPATTYRFKVRALGKKRVGPWSRVFVVSTPPVPAASPAPAAEAPAPAVGAPVAAAPAPSAPQPAPAAPAAPVSGSWWAPVKGTAWQWQLTGTVDTSVNVPVFDIDGEGTSAATVAALHAKGAKVICYFSAGSWEDWRSDKAKFPASVKGKALDGWAGENWLDVRQLSVLLPIMEARIANCKNKGFDAVEPDNVDGYSNDTGFSIGAADQIAYNKGLADLAHKYGLGIALKNDPAQVKELAPFFDFSVAEECAAYGECDDYAPFSAAGKAVLHVEYKGSLDSICASTKPLGFSSMLKNLDLDAWRSPCT